MLDISRVLTVTVLTESILLLLLHHPSILSSDLFSLITFSIPYKQANHLREHHQASRAEGIDHGLGFR